MKIEERIDRVEQRYLQLAAPTRATAAGVIAGIVGTMLPTNDLPDDFVAEVTNILQNLVGKMTRELIPQGEVMPLLEKHAPTLVGDVKTVLGVKA